MIVIAGGTGRLGSAVTRLLAARDLPLRVLTRDPQRAGHLTNPLIEVVTADVHDTASLDRALAGATTVISAIHGLVGTGRDNPRTIDDEGNRRLFEAAQRAGVEHAILISVHGAGPEHPLELARMKHHAETVLRNSALAWTIIRPTVFMETWAELAGTPLLESGKTRLFGRGTNPINFVAVHDIARLVELSVIDPALRGEVVEIGGPQNLTMKEFVATFQRVTGTTGTMSHVPLPMMRVMAAALRPLNASLARLIRASIVMDTHDMTFNPNGFRQRYPALPHTALADVIARDYSTNAPEAAPEYAGSQHAS